MGGFPSKIDQSLVFPSAFVDSIDSHIILRMIRESKMYFACSAYQVLSPGQMVSQTNRPAMSEILFFLE